MWGEISRQFLLYTSVQDCNHFYDKKSEIIKKKKKKKKKKKTETYIMGYLENRSHADIVRMIHCCYGKKIYTVIGLGYCV